MKKVKVLSILLSHAEWQTFQQLSKGILFTFIPCGQSGVKVTTDEDHWKQLGYC
jgi:hypothetical protein